ncbi:uncharacterized protein RJT20DRAFT_173 [Scheffersomyces xylosifermentans]|uniref:uncharacterized protein n=1 Tax=Scheffersomyces xylosifermentans TaxID=1304137 RepID=UPI00315C9BA4
MALTVQVLDPANVLFIFVSLSIALFLVLFVCAYKLFFGNSERSEYTFIGSDFMGSSSNDVPHEFLNDEESLTHLAETYDFSNLSPEEQSAYLKGEEFTKTNPPNFQNIKGKSFSVEDDKIIKDCGTNAFFFEPEQEVLSSRYLVADRTELNFHNNDAPYSTATAVLNYALPTKNRLYSDTIYFETKVYEYNNEGNPNAHFSIGLVTKPYPSSFRLPGYNKFSIGYESTGNLKINKPFPTPLQQHQGEQSEYNALVLPPLQQSDVVGFGYVSSTGTIFITRNGKKILDVMRGCFVDLYPAVGCFSTNAKFQVNIGQLGFVWIEANVRKYGFVSTSDYKKTGGDRGLASLPQYNNVVENDEDKILDKGEELPPRYPEEELDFFGRSSKDIVRLGSSSRSQAQQLAEKGSNEKNGADDEEEEEEFKEPKSGDSGPSSEVTNEPEEIMDLRERIYEQQIENSSESTPLLADPSSSGASNFYESVENGEEAGAEPTSATNESIPDALLEQDHLEQQGELSQSGELEGPSSKEGSRPASKEHTPTSTSGVRSNKAKKKKKKTSSKKKHKKK